MDETVLGPILSRRRLRCSSTEEGRWRTDSASTIRPRSPHFYRWRWSRGAERHNPKCDSSKAWRQDRRRWRGRGGSECGRG